MAVLQRVRSHADGRAIHGLGAIAVTTTLALRSANDEMGRTGPTAWAWEAASRAVFASCWHLTRSVLVLLPNIERFDVDGPTSFVMRSAKAIKDVDRRRESNPRSQLGN